MTEYKPGDRVKHVQYGAGEIIRWDEGRWTVLFTDVGYINNLRPSELTPADPVPDAATLLVRELFAQEHEARGYLDVGAKCRAGQYDDAEEETAFAKYIRANPPQSLTVERVREAIERMGWRTHWAAALHAKLTEQQP